MNDQNCIWFPAKEVPLIADVDVLVVGAGPAGSSAAIMAGRLGADVLLLDSASVPGGMTTTGMMSHYTGTVDSRLYEEILHENALKNMFETGQRKVQIDPTQMTLTWIDLLEKAHARMLMYTTAMDPLLDGDRITGVTVFSKDGMSAVKAHVVIDATGDGDIAARAGVPFHMGRETDGSMQPATLMFKIGGVDMDRAVFPGGFESLVETSKGELQSLAKKLLPHPAGHVLLYQSPIPGIVTVNMTNAINIDGTHAQSLTEA